MGVSQPLQKIKMSLASAHILHCVCQIKYLSKSYSNKFGCSLLDIQDQTEEAWQDLGLGAKLI